MGRNSGGLFDSTPGHGNCLIKHIPIRMLVSALPSFITRMNYNLETHDSIMNITKESNWIPVGSSILLRKELERDVFLALCELKLMTPRVKQHEHSYCSPPPRCFVSTSFVDFIKTGSPLFGDFFYHGSASII